ncbi:MAG TPA: DUF4491 domain-containing protein [Porphyromonadaceae bacterium]|nr:DUF4491 domain-containing protein [Porphyromonadaceae bacterium]
MFRLLFDFMTDYQLVGISIGISTFLIIGLFHPIVIKAEYYFGTGCWWLFAVMGFVFIYISISIENIFLSALSAVISASSFWSIKELFEQKRRVEKGWFPKRKRRQ